MSAVVKARTGTRERGRWPLGRKVSVDLRGVMPVAKGSMRAFMPKGGKFPVVTDSKTGELRAFERDVRQLFGVEMDRQQLPCATEQPFEILLCYFMERPSGDYDKHGGVRAAARCSPWVKPDLDKLERATLDALSGLVYDDDSRVVRVVKEKRFATAERDTGLWIEARVQPATMRELADWVQQSLMPIEKHVGG